MADRGNRGGDPVSPTITTVGTEGTTAQEYQFQQTDGVQTYARIVFITNMHETETVYILVNEEEAAADNFLIALDAGEVVEVSAGGRLNVRNLSIFTGGGGDYDTVKITAWV